MGLAMNGNRERDIERRRKTDLRLDRVIPKEESSRTEDSPRAAEPAAGISREEIDILWQAGESERKE